MCHNLKMADSASRPARSQFGRWVICTSDPVIGIDGFDKSARTKPIDLVGRVGGSCGKAHERSQFGGAGSRVGDGGGRSDADRSRGQERRKDRSYSRDRSQLMFRLQLLYGSLLTRGKPGDFGRRTKPIREMIREESPGVGRSEGAEPEERYEGLEDGRIGSGNGANEAKIGQGGRTVRPVVRGEWGTLSAVEFGFLLRLSGLRLR
jgi:hypothetical protein